ncbi:MAG: hypothetical protein ACYDAB_00580 [bacterium]
MMQRVASRRSGIRASAGAREHLRYAAVYHHTGPRLGRSRRSAAWVERTWWHRLVDDHELIGAKLLLLAALLALTALLERVV